MDNTIDNTTELFFSKFPFYLKVFMKHNKELDTISVEIHSTIHVNKIVTMPISWSFGFYNVRNNQFRSDIAAFIIKNYGLKLNPVSYT